MRKLFFFLFCVCVSLSVFAHNFESGGIYYNITSSTQKTVSVTYEGSSSYSADYSGSVTIPSSVTYNGTTYSVTSIGNDAFYNCSGLTSITIPNSVISIGRNAFGDCRGLTSVTIDSQEIVGKTSFSSNFKGIFGSQVEKYVIGNSVTSIGEDAFEYCSGLTSVTIPNSVTSIGRYAFYWCSGLTSVTIPNSVTSIGEYAFSGCSGLTSVTIPNSVTSIGEYAFYYCGGLTSVTIPNSVTSIGNNAFYYCSGLTSVTIPNSVTSIGRYAFSNCSGLTSVTIPNSVTSIGESAFSNCSGLTSVTIPNSVTSIGNYAFYQCSGLTSVTIGTGINAIYAGAFVYSSLKNVIMLRESPTKLYDNDREYCFTTFPGNGPTLYVPDKSVNIYLSATNYLNNFKQIVPLSEYGTKVQQIQLSETDVTISKGNSMQLVATVLPVDASNKKLLWSSTDENIATVDETGLVTAIGIGNAAIIAKSTDGSNVEASCNITVNPIILTYRPHLLGGISWEVENGKSYTFKIHNPEGYVVHSMSWNGEDVSDQLTADNEYTTPPITENSEFAVVFQTPSNVDGKKDDRSNVKVLAYNGNIIVVGAKDGEQISCFGVDGLLEKSVRVSQSREIVSLTKDKIYVIKVGNESFKVRL